ncbi:uncharacterized protein LOC142317425 isoform X2 [Lycorma delicatula]|uniref:uncharacterized protein LOC142317425 isoform X2 n=1 Tax=Lycorma delicatula TaxID=130591 RepID=UPI003F517C62
MLLLLHHGAEANRKEERCSLNPKAVEEVAEVQFCPSSSQLQEYNLALNQYRSMDLFQQQVQHQIKVEPEISFYGCRGESDSNSTDDMEVNEVNRMEMNNPSSSPVQQSSPVITKTEPRPSKPQTCQVCGKVLSSASSYYVHMKLHSGSKPFHCTVCEASFCRKPYLEVHMRTHTGERPFQCDLCLKRFTQKSSLNTHKRVHTGERPYECDICQKRFAVKSYVSAHRWSHVAEKPLGCDQCSLTFTSKTQFTIHMRTHMPGSMYDCHICGRSFVRDSYLIRHHNRVHRDMPQHSYQELGYHLATID